MKNSHLVDSYINEVSKLNGDNYVNWKFKLISILEELNLWMIVKGDEHKPSYALSISEWNLLEVQAKVALHMSVKDNIIPHIIGCKTSKDTWDKLKGFYETSDPNRICF